MIFTGFRWWSPWKFFSIIQVLMSYLLFIRCNKMSAFLTGKLTSTCISAHVLFIFHTPKCTFIEYDSWSVL
jgi:hypothetical protein